MPELPEVEVLVRHLAPLLRGRRVRAIEVKRARVIRPHSIRELKSALTGACFVGLERRGKYLLFTLRKSQGRQRIRLLGHLGMTGRFYLQREKDALPKHAAVVFRLDRHRLVLEDTRYFGRLTLDTSCLEALGPEPLSDGFTVESLARSLAQSSQPVKVKLLDQAVVAGVGNIYASEALFRARMAPGLPANKLEPGQIRRLHRAVRDVLVQAVQFGSTVPLDWDGRGFRDRLFYYGVAEDAPDYYTERLRVYDREGSPCVRCRTPIRKFMQAARSTFFCPECQRS